MLRIAIVAALTACAHDPGVARYYERKPPALTPVAPPVARDEVRIAVKELPWWTTVENGREYILELGDPDTALLGTAIGPVRSSDVLLARDAHQAVRCAFQLVAMGDPRPCPGDRDAATEIAQPFLDRALADMRGKAGDAGADGVRDVRCYTSANPKDRASDFLWCEGTAIAIVAVTTPEPPGTRLLVVADASVGALGDQPVVGTTVGLRYRPLEFGFYIADLSRYTLAPTENGIIGLGGTLLGRFAIGRSRADVIAGATAAVLARNNSMNPDVDARYYGFAGIAYQTSWRLGNYAQPFVQLRAGAARSTAMDSKLRPMLELHFGLTTPERRCFSGSRPAHMTRHRRAGHRTRRPPAPGRFRYRAPRSSAGLRSRRRAD
jgi:hypothetical protein